MNKSKAIFEKLGKLVEQTVVNYKDLSSEIVNIFKSNRDEFIFKMKITSKEETEIIKKRVEKLEKKIDILEKKKTKSAKRR